MRRIAGQSVHPIPSADRDTGRFDQTDPSRELLPGPERFVHELACSNHDRVQHRSVSLLVHVSGALVRDSAAAASIDCPAAADWTDSTGQRSARQAETFTQRASLSSMEIGASTGVLAAEHWTAVAMPRSVCRWP